MDSPVDPDLLCDESIDSLIDPIEFSEMYDEPDIPMNRYRFTSSGYLETDRRGQEDGFDNMDIINFVNDNTQSSVTAVAGSLDHSSDFNGTVASDTSGVNESDGCIMSTQKKINHANFRITVKHAHANHRLLKVIKCGVWKVHFQVEISLDLHLEY